MGNFKNNGREWRPKGTSELVEIDDFIDLKLRRGSVRIYDLTNNIGWISVGTDGKKSYPSQTT